MSSENQKVQFKKDVVKPNNKPTDFNSKKFKKGLKRVKKEIKEIEKGMRINTLDLFKKFNI